MPAERIDQGLLFRYLLGDLSEEQQVEVEDRAFGDKEYLGALEAAEVDLIDAWVRGELNKSERRAFEARFLTSPQRRHKVEFARALTRVASESELLSAPSERLWRWPFALQWAAGLACVLCVTAATWFAVENSAMRSRVSTLEARLQQQQQLPTAGVALLILLPGLSRAEAQVPQVEIGASAQIVRIEVRLDARDDYPRYRAELRTRAGTDVMTFANLAGGQRITLDVPVTSLQAGQYELALKGMKGTSAEEIGFYYFNVGKQ